MAGKKVARPSPLIAGRIARCRRTMKKHGLRAYLVTSRMDHYYLTGFTGEDSAVLITPREVHVISDGRFDETINRECPWAKRWLRRDQLTDEVATVLKTLTIKSLAVQADHMTLADHGALRKKARGTRLTPAPSILSDMRCQKDNVEVGALRKAVRVAEEAFVALRRTIRVGQTEQELAARLEYEMHKRGASGASFPTICAEGSRAALPHATPGRRKVKEGGAILFDWGAKVGFYCSDLTRMVFVGRIPKRFAVLYRVVLESQRRAIAALRPGRPMCDIDEVARVYITEAGYGEQFVHGLGHGLGLSVHEPPSLSWRSSDKLKAGMVVTVEPGVYVPGVGGVRIEDDVLVTPNGSRVLSRLGKTPEDAVLRRF